MRIIRLMCTGRVDLSFVIRALAQGADGVFIGGCWPGECHYITEGNYDALGNMHLCRKLLGHLGIEPERLRLEWIAASEGSRFAEVTNDFVQILKRLGPLHRDGAVKTKLAAAAKLIPFIKLVERERLRVPVKSVEAYEEFFTSPETDRLFSRLIADKLAVSQIVTLLAEGPRSTGEISEALNLNPSDVSRHMNASSRQGLVRYDVGLARYALA